MYPAPGALGVLLSKAFWYSMCFTSQDTLQLDVLRDTEQLQLPLKPAETVDAHALSLKISPHSIK